MCVCCSHSGNVSSLINMNCECDGRHVHTIFHRKLCHMNYALKLFPFAFRFLFVFIEYSSANAFYFDIFLSKKFHIKRKQKILLLKNDYFRYFVLFCFVFLSQCLHVVYYWCKTNLIRSNIFAVFRFLFDTKWLVMNTVCDAFMFLCEIAFKTNNNQDPFITLQNNNNFE